MRLLQTTILCALTVPVLWVVAFAARAAATSPVENWPQWRGPLATGEAPRATPPVTWSETENVRFKVPLPGRGHSTPVVWGDRLFLTTAIAAGEPFAPRPSDSPGAHDNLPVSSRFDFVVLALDRKTGKELWRRTVKTALPHEGGHYTASLASASPATDGELLFAFFGSYGLYALTLDGEVRWSRDFGRMRSKHGHGEGSSPVLDGDTLVVNWDHEGESFVVALDATTGKDRWRAVRNEVTSWATPIVVEHAGRKQLIVSGTGRVRGYDLGTGEVIWECGGLSANIVASPVSAGGIVYAGSSYEKRALLAIRLEGAVGDITGTENVLWTRTRGTPYVPSPLLYRDTLYFLRHYQGILSRVDGPTGKEELGPFRLGGLRDIYASPVAAAGRLYVTDRWGQTLVVSHDDPKPLGLNALDDVFNASAAIVGDTIYLRGEEHLYALSESP
ncbi:MAG: PQQ-binding-like beta-propeller repeat protein [Acidobacteriota bacterium]